MATNPPFYMEDQTDEDFFDNLVNDDHELKPPGRFPQSDPDIADVFSNVSIEGSGEEGTREVKNGNDSVNFGDGLEDAPLENERKVLPSSSSFDFDSVVESEVSTDVVDNLTSETRSVMLVKQNVTDTASELPSAVSGEGSSLVSSNSFELDALTTANKNLELEGSVDRFKGKNFGSTGGIKEVGWNSFHADSTVQDGTDVFGSYSDLLSGMNNSCGDFPGMQDGFISDDKTVPNSMEYLTDVSGFAVGYTQHERGQGYDTGGQGNANIQDLNSSQYWENLYPGWGYDSNTGQWYQIGGDNSNMYVQGSNNNAEMNEPVSYFEEKSEVYYMQQSAQYVDETVQGTGTTETVSNWNQVPEGNNGYPEHMVFDPQYPGWYYDMIALEWRSLDSYTSADQSTSQSHHYHIQNGLNSAADAYQNNDSNYNNYGQIDSHASQGLVSENQGTPWAGRYGQANADYAWQQQPDSYAGDQQIDASYVSTANRHMEKQSPINSFSAVMSYDMQHQSHSMINGSLAMPSFIASQPANQEPVVQSDQGHFSDNIYGNQKSTSFSQQAFQTPDGFGHAHNIGRSSAGRPPHALVAFGFGGKLIVMKESSNLSFGAQDSSGGSVSVLNIMEIVQKSDGSSNYLSYFHALCHQSFPGPLVGGNVGNKELNKWTDERIGNCESSNFDYRKAESLRLLLSLLKIACQHYGKLRSPFGTDLSMKGGDSPEVAVAKLFASTKRIGAQFSDYGAQRQCLQLFPPAEQAQATALEVQNLLVSGKKKEALQIALDGQLWGPALVLASQLGDQYYVDTVKQMALRQLVPGSPLRTLCLLIAGKPAEVFSAEPTPVTTVPHASYVIQQPAQFGANCMLEDWEENLAVITANRTKDDELVLMHLGDCLWKERNENVAAHLCYLVAEVNFESYSDSARVCLVGADHWKCPRTYASPEAIQRTELYEYSKVLGNPQFILLPFQPYKIIYAHMLAEVGKISDSLKYCHALLKSLKTGRAPEVDMWKQVVLSLEERIKIHQQGGYSANLARKLLNFFDSTAHRVVNGGGLPPLAPTTSSTSVQGSNQFNRLMDQKVPNSQSVLGMSSLAPSLSMEPISDWTGDNNRKTVPNRSVSEPDFGRSPRQAHPSNELSSAGGEKTSASGSNSRFGRFGFGSQLLQKTVGLVLGPRSDRQAKLGEKNKFYYNEKLKRWVEEGAEPPKEEAALPPPPTTASFPNGASDYNLKSALKTEGSISNGSSTPLPEQTQGIPPMPPSSNQFSARGRMGIRSRYVDTFNKGGGSPANLFQSPSVPVVKPTGNAGAPKFFIPAAVAPSSEQQQMDPIAESSHEEGSTNEAPSTSAAYDLIPSSLAPSQMTSMERFPSMGNIPRRASMVEANSSFQTNSRRTASWSGILNNSYSTPPNNAGVKTLAEQLGYDPLSLMPTDHLTPMQMPVNGGGSFDELQEVEL
ncbi:hypothetical protein SAY86_010611 [Trapa natans]|uniref:Protein transport protein sec16 n=1 Tax=Trapa natans TaxID=22666 RepID=A0AAN7LEY1_TRANT|nr:hypothetical protein SAY86_010611 [Trapa natans]